MVEIKTKGAFLMPVLSWYSLSSARWGSTRACWVSSKALFNVHHFSCPVVRICLYKEDGWDEFFKKAGISNDIYHKISQFYVIYSCNLITPNMFP